jgi:riboflavin kinase / FMN adenylyltransferase
VEVYPGLAAARDRLRTGGCVTVGTFDGVHRGHQALLTLLDELAGDAPAVVLTFRRHPLSLFHPEKTPQPLTSVERRLELLALAGADAVILEEFDPAFGALTAEELLVRLRDELGVRGLVRGFDHHFGSDRAGPTELAALARVLGLEDRVLEPVRCCGIVAKSQRVRELLTAGDVARAACLLGRPHRVLGRVVRGLGLGRRLGAPTANLPDYYEMAPRTGVYVVSGRLIGHTFHGAANVGWRPSVEAPRHERPLLEVHLFGLDREAYGAALAVDFHHRLRDEERFDDLDELRGRIAADIAAAREWWAENPDGVPIPLHG